MSIFKNNNYHLRNVKCNKGLSNDLNEKLSTQLCICFEEEYVTWVVIKTENSNDKISLLVKNG